MSQEIAPFEEIRRTNSAGNEFWSSRDFAQVLGYVNYRNFPAVIKKTKTACSNSGQQIEDHFVGADQMVEIGGFDLAHQFRGITKLISHGKGCQV